MNRARRSLGIASLPILPFAVFLGIALTATTLVPASKAGRSAQSITANALKPAACAALGLSGITTGSGTFNDTNASNLVLGSAFVDTIRGRNGSDCILGGGGNDSLRGDGGTDICIGGPGTDTFFASCETQIQ